MTRDANLKVRVKSAKGRKLSSTRWLERQLNDPYVREANRLGYRSRAAFKILEIDDKFKIFKPGQCILDLGANNILILAGDATGLSRLAYYRQ